jgi:hypothetical protein
MRLKLDGGQTYETDEVTTLLLWLKIRKTGMICSVKPVLTEDLCVVKKEEFSIIF